jgi:hypothetical protein
LAEAIALWKGMPTLAATVLIRTTEAPEADASLSEGKAACMLLMAPMKLISKCWRKSSGPVR